MNSIIASTNLGGQIGLIFYIGVLKRTLADLIKVLFQNSNFSWKLTIFGVESVIFLLTNFRLKNG